jgi:hypothetical protein
MSAIAVTVAAVAVRNRLARVVVDIRSLSLIEGPLGPGARREG